MNVETDAFAPAVPQRPAYTATRVAFILITSLFFMWGLSHGLLDVLNKHFQDTLNVTRGQSGFVQTAYFGAYFLVALPVGRFMEHFGYKAGILLGLSLFALGSLLFVPASLIGTFAPFLISLFVLASGLTCIETAANLYAVALGAPEKAEQRLTLSHTFYGLGAFIGPIIGGSVFFVPPVDVAGHQVEAASLTYVGLAALVILVMIAFAKTPLPEIREGKGASPDSPTDMRSLWTKKNFTGALLAQFCSVGAYIGVGAYFINFALDHWPDLSAQKAAFLLSLGMLAYMIGRFAGTILMRYVDPRKLMIFNCFASMVMCIIAMAEIEKVSVIAAIGIYLFMSTMYPTIFAMGVRGLGSETKKAGSFLMMTLVGGAFLPLAMGAIADQVSIAAAFVIPLICFVVIGWYGLSQRSPLKVTH